MAYDRLDELVRSERYFTATLLPALLLRDPVADVVAFLAWLDVELGLHGHTVDAPAERASLRLDAPPSRLEVVTELNFKRDLGHYDDELLAAAAATPAVQEARAAGTDRQSVPDLVILADDLLVVIEGKFFVDGVTPASLNRQLVEQREEIALMVAHLGGRVRRVAHLYLGPRDLGELDCDGTFTWADVATWAAGRVGEDHYVTQRLRGAVARYEHLRARARGGVGRNYARLVDFDTLLAECVTRGDAVRVGFYGGEEALRAAALPALLDRPFKLDEAGPGTGAKRQENWLSGTQVLALLREKGVV